jgi:2-(1,2-epoxy-1,2-dihydrophenyl)acetyl-CoA isomerase
MPYQELVVEVDGAVATIRMDNAEKLNALSPTLTGELVQALQELGQDPSVRALILTGTGRGFSAGADLATFQEPYMKGERPKLSRFLKEGYNRLIPLLTEAPKPVIAALNGVVAGAGISLALACDIRIASEEAAFWPAFVKIGLIPDSGSSYLLPRTVGIAKALELAITGDPIDATTALHLGLVHKVFPPEHLQSGCAELAVRLAALPTRAIALTKRAFNEATRMTLSQAMDLEAELQDEAGATDDHIEGVLAFLEKRTPTFTGK